MVVFTIKILRKREEIKLQVSMKRKINRLDKLVYDARVDANRLEDIFIKYSSNVRFMYSNNAKSSWLLPYLMLRD